MIDGGMQRKPAIFALSRACIARVLEFRIRLPPADSPSLAGFLLAASKSRQLPRRARARPGGTAGRDARGSSTSRQLPVVSLSGAIPVPQCQLGGLRPWLPGAPSKVRLRPAEWQTRMRQQFVCGQIWRLTAVEDGFGDVRGEIAEAYEPREIGRAHPAWPVRQTARHRCPRVWH